jgi:hypothetical protein
MSGIAIGVIGLLIAAAIATRGVLLMLAARRLRARLVPIAARVTKQGKVAQTRLENFTNSDGDNIQRIEHVFVGAWEYTVGGQRHTGGIDARAPVFRDEDMPPATIQVFHDRDDPAVSRLHRDADAGVATPWFIFAAVVAAVSLLIVVIANADRWLGR